MQSSAEHVRPLDKWRETASTAVGSSYGMWRNRRVDNTQTSMRDQLRKEAGDHDGLTSTTTA